MSIKRTLASFVTAAAVMASLAMPQAQAAVLQQLNVWWPANSVSVTGIQPFKAMLNGYDISQYYMYWQVDGGQLNRMGNNYADYPHKESLVDLSGWTWRGQGPYLITFKAYNGTGSLIGKQSVSIYVGNGPTLSTVSTIVAPIATPTPSATPVAIPTPSPTTDPHVRDSSVLNMPQPSLTPTPSATPVSTVVTPVVNTSNPLSGAKLYVNPYSDPANWVRTNQTTDPTDAALMNKIAAQPESEWFGNWNSNPYQDAKNTTDTITALGDTPVYVIYDIPQRDCGSYSAGGASSPDAYRTFVSDIANGIGNRKAVILLEPDALAGIDCLSAADQATRLSLLNYAVTTFAQHGLPVYIDAGNPSWQSVSTMIQRLNAAGIESAQGFVLNISNFITTTDNISYGTAISTGVGGKHFLIDTGRNGSGPSPDGQWCNPPSRSLGQQPTTNTSNPLVDAYLWVKGPGGSDGTCNGGPSAGIFWPSYALGLANRTQW